MSDWPVSME